MTVTATNAPPVSGAVARLACAIVRPLLSRNARHIAVRHAALRAICGSPPFSNGFFHGTAGYRRVAMASSA